MKYEMTHPQMRQFVDQIWQLLIKIDCIQFFGGHKGKTMFLGHAWYPYIIYIYISLSISLVLGQQAIDPLAANEWSSQLIFKRCIAPRSDFFIVFS